MNAQSNISFSEFIVSTPDLTLELLQINPSDFLANENLMRQAAKLYREIYGSAETRDGKVIWGYGAYDSGNPKNKISLDDFYHRQANGNLSAPSGEVYQLCFPDEYMAEKFQHDLAATLEQRPYLGCLQAYTRYSQPDAEVIGLTWGGLTSFKLIKESLTQDLMIDTSELNEKQLDDVMELLRSRVGPNQNEKVLYIRELIIREDYRKAGQYAAYLVKLVLEHGEKFGNANLFFWTAANSLMTYIALAGGLTKIYESADCQFFYGEDKVMRQLAEDYRKAKDIGLFFKQRLLNYLRLQRKTASIVGLSVTL